MPWVRIAVAVAAMAASRWAARTALEYAFRRGYSSGWDSASAAWYAEVARRLAAGELVETPEPAGDYGRTPGEPSWTLGSRPN